MSGNNNRIKIYTNIDNDDLLGDMYVKHICAMTGESLHSKAEIACELAARDLVIKKLKELLMETSVNITNPQQLTNLIQEIESLKLDKYTIGGLEYQQ